MKEAAVHLVQRLLSLRKTRVPGRRNHHVEDLRHRIPAERSSAASDVVPHSPQTLVLSSTSTTSLGPKAPAAYRTWCLTPRKPLFFRPQAPRLSGQRRRRRTGRGASLPTNPYSFVRKHHVSRVQWDFDVMDVVPHPPRKPLFLRPEAPRPKVRMGRRTHRRGALSPTNPCSFVRKHHIPRSGWADAGTDVVLHTPQTLVFSSGSTTSSPPDGIGKGSADEFAIRLHFLPLLFCIDRKSSGAIAPLLFLHNPIKFYYFTFPLLFGAV